MSEMATGILTHGATALSGVSCFKALVTQSWLMNRGVRLGGALQYAAMLHAERWTMPTGEPVAGICGKGFIARRHAHTVVHESMLSATRRLQDGAVALSAGRGIVPFGTDDSASCAPVPGGLRQRSARGTCSWNGLAPRSRTGRVDHCVRHWSRRSTRRARPLERECTRRADLTAREGAPAGSVSRGSAANRPETVAITRSHLLTGQLAGALAARSRWHATLIAERRMSARRHRCVRSS